LFTCKLKLSKLLTVPDKKRVATFEQLQIKVHLPEEINTVKLIPSIGHAVVGRNFEDGNHICWSMSGTVKQEMVQLEARFDKPCSSITATVNVKTNDYTFSQSSVESIYVGSGVGPTNAAFGELTDPNTRKPSYTKEAHHVAYTRDCVYRID